MSELRGKAMDSETEYKLAHARAILAHAELDEKLREAQATLDTEVEYRDYMDSMREWLGWQDTLMEDYYKANSRVYPSWDELNKED